LTFLAGLPIESIRDREVLARSPLMSPGFQPVRNVYLVSKPPAVSHSFILRELKRLCTTNYDGALVSVAGATGEDS
jgi:hypothetical protein